MVKLPDVDGEWSFHGEHVNTCDSNWPVISIPPGRYVTYRYVEPKPKPEIRVGDVIHYDGQDRVVFELSLEPWGNTMRYVDVKTRDYNGWSIKSFIKHNDAKIYRNGQLIWQRSREP